MSKRSGISFTRRAPDNLTEELIAVLSSKASFEFKPLFEIILVNLRERNAASGGEAAAGWQEWQTREVIRPARLLPED